MSEDPRQILAEAGVECAEVNALYVDGRYNVGKVDDYADDAILALARLVAKYKWQRDWCCDGNDPDFFKSYDETAVEYLERRWAERQP